MGAADVGTSSISFSSMKAAAVKALEDSKAAAAASVVSSDDGDDSNKKGIRSNTDAHLRKGGKGGWRSHFTNETGDVNSEECQRLLRIIQSKYDVTLGKEGLVYDVGDNETFQ